MIADWNKITAFLTFWNEEIEVREMIWSFVLDVGIESTFYLLSSLPDDEKRNEKRRK